MSAASVRTGALATFAALVLVTGLAHAETAPREPVSLSIDASIALDHEAVRARLADALTREVRLVERDADETMVRLIGTRGRGVRIVARGLDGTLTRRFVSLPRREDERVASLVLHLESLLRDDARALAQRLREARTRSTAAPEATESETIASTATTTESLTTRAPEVVTEPTEPEVVAEPEVVTEPDVAADPEATTDTEAVTESEAETETILEESEPERPWTQTSPTWIRFGLGTQLSAFQSSSSGYDLVWWAGLHVAATITEWLAIGVRELGAGLATTNEVGAGGVLFFELAWRLDTYVDLHLGGGGHMQAIIPPMGQLVFGFAPVGGLGARFWVHPNVSIGLDVEIRWIATNTFHAGVPIVPFGELLASAGLSTLVHL
ncbi:MAG: hypothetical protein J0L92_32210 [Deltaproteobacteria bacterium]|nr:hypothetical protein [Deltaproteobacteria bacterium]